MYSPPRYESAQGYTTTFRFASPPAQPPSAYSKFAYATPPKDPHRRHVRTGSLGVPPTYAYTSPQQAPPAYYTSPTYSAGGAYYYTPQRPAADYVSGPDRSRPRTSVRRPSQSDGANVRISMDSKKLPKTTKSFRAQFAPCDGDFDDEGYYSPGKGHSPPPPYNKHATGPRVADHYSYEPQVSSKVATDSLPKYKTSSRHRSASYSTPHTDSKSARTKSSAKPKSAPKATSVDAQAAHIPAGYNYKNWDPTEEPILLLGSVFDANSLGRWIYDFTVYHHGASTPMSDLAGDLWLLLIQLAGKIKRAEECLPRIRHHEDRELVEDFLDSGERIWERFNKILKTCEEYMWRVAQKEAKKKGSSGKANMGPKSGCEFVDTIFGRDRQLGDTEKLMQGMRLWSHRFDVNCEEIMRHPAA